MPETPQYTSCLATYAVDDRQRKDSGEHVHRADQHLRKERVAARQSGILEDRRSVVEHGVDTHELPEDGDEGADGHGSPDAGFEQRAPLRFVALSEGRAYGGDLLLASCRAG